MKPVAPKAKTWSPDFAPPPAPPADEYGPEEYAEQQDNGYDDTSDDETVATIPAQVATRPPKKRNRLAILVGLIAFVVGGLGTGGYFLFKYIHERPDRLFVAAKKEYDANNFLPARDQFQKFLKEYPDDQRARPRPASSPSWPTCGKPLVP